MSIHHLFNYSITANPQDVDDGHNHSEAMTMVAAGMHELLMQMAPGFVTELKRLIKANPQEPIFRNQLTNYYRIKGMMEKAYIQNRETLKLFPDYVFARVYQAHEYIETGQTTKVEEVLGRMLEIGDMLPERRTFHVGEVVAFNQAVIRYLIAINKFDLAENRMELFIELLEKFPGVPGAQLAALYDDLQFAKIRAGVQVEGIPIPKLENQLLYELYCNSLRIDDELLKKMLALPKESLLKDLSIVVRNSFEQFDQWKSIQPDPRITEHPTHALYLLCAIGDDSTLPVVLDLLGQSEKVLDFWFGDFLLEDYWKFIYVLGAGRLNTLLHFILQPGVYFFARSVISQAIYHIALVHPERRPDVLQWYRSLLHELNTRPEFLENKEVVPADLYLADMTNFNAVELEEEMIRT